jgi:hypothetical protein
MQVHVIRPTTVARYVSGGRHPPSHCVGAAGTTADNIPDRKCCKRDEAGRGLAAHRRLAIKQLSHGQNLQSRMFASTV